MVQRKQNLTPHCQQWTYQHPDQLWSAWSPTALDLRKSKLYSIPLSIFYHLCLAILSNGNTYSATLGCPWNDWGTVRKQNQVTSAPSSLSSPELAGRIVPSTCCGDKGCEKASPGIYQWAQPVKGRLCPGCTLRSWLLSKACWNRGRERGPQPQLLSFPGSHLGKQKNGGSHILRIWSSSPGSRSSALLCFQKNLSVRFLENAETAPQTEQNRLLFWAKLCTLKQQTGVPILDLDM